MTRLYPFISGPSPEICEKLRSFRASSSHHLRHNPILVRPGIHESLECFRLYSVGLIRHRKNGVFLIPDQNTLVIINPTDTLESGTFVGGGYALEFWIYLFGIGCLDGAWFEYFRAGSSICLRSPSGPSEGRLLRSQLFSPRGTRGAGRGERCSRKFHLYKFFRAVGDDPVSEGLRPSPQPSGKSGLRSGGYQRKCRGSICSLYSGAVGPRK